MGRLPSMTSTLLCITGSESQVFNKCYSDSVIHDNDTNFYDNLNMLKAAVRLPDVLNSAPPALVTFMLSAAERNEPSVIYSTIPKLAWLLHNPGKKISVSANISIHCHHTSVLNGFRAMHYPGTEPLYLLLDEMHKRYQVRLFRKHITLDAV
jgi:hypothetical protein